MKSLIESQLNLILLLSLLIGLFIPNIELTPNFVVTLLLATMVLFLSSKVDVSEIQDIKIKSVLGFYLSRFILLPILLFYFAEWLIPKYSTAILLLTLLPVGITTPMLVANFKGNATFALALTIATSLLAPIMLPLVFMNLGFSTVIEIQGLFITLFSIIIIPLGLYYLIIKLNKNAKVFFMNNSTFVSITLLGVIVAIVLSKQKDAFLNDVFSLFVVAMILLLMFFIFYLFGWFYPIKRDQMPFVVCNSISSGAINTALGINLSLLYFSDDTVFFMVVSEFVWVASIPLFQVFYQKVSKA